MKNLIKLYQVYDRVAEAVTGPILSTRNDGAAIRHFFDGLATKGTTLNEHPEDYELKLMGTQDPDTGIIYGNEQPVTVTTGTVWKEVQQQRETAKANGNNDLGQ